MIHNVAQHHQRFGHFARALDAQRAVARAFFEDGGDVGRGDQFKDLPHVDGQKARIVDQEGDHAQHLRLPLSLQGGAEHLFELLRAVQTGRVQHALQGGGVFLAHALADAQKDVFLGRKVMVNGALGQPRALHDVLHEVFS